MYAPNNIVAKYVKQKLINLKGEIDIFTITVEHFNTSHSVIHKSTRYKISKDKELNITVNQWDLTVFIKYLMQLEQNTNMFQVHMKYLPR